MALLKDKIEIGIEEGEIKLQKQLLQFPPLIRWLLIVAVIAIIPAYYVARSFSESYWLKTWDNLMVSAKASFSAAKPPKVSDITLLTIGNSTYAAIATVNNENLDLYAGGATYTFNLYDAKKTLLYSASGPFFILPNQTKYISIPKIFSLNTPASADVEFSQPLKWQKRLNIPNVNLVANTDKFYNQINPLTFAVEGNIYNNSPYALESVQLTFLLYDSAKNLVGTSVRTEFTLSPFERRTFKQLWPNVYSQNVQSVKIVADTDPLAPGNLSIPASSGNSAGNLTPPTPTSNSPF